MSRMTTTMTTSMTTMRTTVGTWGTATMANETSARDSDHDGDHVGARAALTHLRAFQTHAISAHRQAEALRAWRALRPVLTVPENNALLTAWSHARIGDRPGDAAPPGAARAELDRACARVRLRLIVATANRTADERPS